MQSDNLLYEEYEKERFQRFKGICKRCGECCGSSDEDPCANLAKDEATASYYCRSYEDRLGPQKTVSGNIFNCISIRDAIRQNHLRANCAYNSITGKTNTVELFSFAKAIESPAFASEELFQREYSCEAKLMVLLILRSRIKALEYTKSR